MALRCLPLLFLYVPLCLAQSAPTANQTKPESPPAIVPPHQTDPAQDSQTSAPADSKTPTWRSRIHFGGLVVGAGYVYASGGYSPFYRYSPPLWAPFYHPGYYSGFLYQDGRGEVKIHATDKTSLIYLDGALAGRLDKLKDLWLDPGVYDLEVRNTTHRFTQKLYVLSGKTLQVTTDMMVDEVVR